VKALSWLEDAAQAMVRHGRDCPNYSRRIYNLAYRFTSKADAAEDLTQEVFIRVYRSLDQYNPKQGDLQNWLMRLARNRSSMTIASGNAPAG
jgi:RNA polymerase sigma factor (sigma-70 family)